MAVNFKDVGAVTVVGPTTGGIIIAYDVARYMGIEAIYAEDDVPDDQQDFIQINAELASQWKVIVERKDALPDADDWAGVKEKRHLLER